MSATATRAFGGKIARYSFADAPAAAGDDDRLSLD
jgi:hypothetical protein